MEQKWEFRLADEITIDEQVQLFNETFNMNATPNSWRRKHLNNPLGDGKHIQVFAAFCDGELAGINGFVPMEYTYKGETYRVIQSCDTAVDPKFRGKGVFTRIINAAEDYYRSQGYTALVGFPNNNSYHGFIKMKWQDVHHTMKYFLPCDVKNVGKIMLNRNLPGFLDPLASIWFHIHNGYISERNSMYKLKVIDHIKVEEFNHFLNDDKIHINMSQEYLDWKLSAPHKWFRVFVKDRLVCSVLSSEFSISETIRRANILGVSRCDGSKKEFRKAFAIVLDKMRREYNILSVWESRDEDINKVFLQTGFIMNFTEKKGSPFIVKPLVENEKVVDSLLDSKLWEPVFIEADYVLDHNVK